MSPDSGEIGRASSASPTGPMLDIDVRLAFGGFDLEVEQSIPAAGVTAVFGPSGGGKTTLLRALLGFEPGARGRIALGGETWLDSERGVRTPSYLRPVGCTFQDGRLFPHLDVAGNLHYADRRSAPASDAAVSITRDDVVDALDLEPLLGRRPHTLSGGERQRVALGRALLSRPRLLLLDEPLSALDRRRKAEILPYLLALHPRFGIPTLYVSHAVDEVALLADRILVLADGRVQAFGGTVEVLEQLDLAPLTERFQAAALLEARVSAHDDEYRLSWLDLGGQRLSVPGTSRSPRSARRRPASAMCCRASSWRSGRTSRPPSPRRRSTSGRTGCGRGSRVRRPPSSALKWDRRCSPCSRA